MDFQNRVGSKPGAGGAASAQNEAIDRRERLRKLALETIDINKDPYFMKNHLGQYECKLCLTLHMNEGNYLAHTQGKRHQYNLGRRAAQEARDREILPQPVKQKISIRKSIKIGRPCYRVTKQRDPETNQRSLIFQIDYPEIEEGLQPRHRFMSAYEQKVEAADRNFQYVLFAAEPYETIAFKIPNKEIDKDDQKFYTDWDAQKQTFTVQFYFKEEHDGPAPPAPPSGPAPPAAPAPPPPPPPPN
jgi:splicing factor 3A subunit 2